jgi:DNA-binding PadR family transcriptional regulator
MLRAVAETAPPTAVDVATLTTTEAAVLALLEIEGERSGYDLLKIVTKAIGYVWAPARSRLYALLPRLVDSGLAARREVVQTGRPSKQLYRITDVGSASLHAWLESADDGTRETFFLKLFVGGLVSRQGLVAHVERFRAEQQARLDEYLAIEPTNTRAGHDAYHYLLLRLGIEEVELRLRWADWVLEELDRIEGA